jgi:hypothetical protein
MYERLKQEMYQCKRLIENKKIETAFGKISLLENKVEYDPVALLKGKGPEWLIEHSSPNMSKLDKLVDEGRLTPNDILQFRTVLDTRLDFMVMSLESEKKALQMFDWKRSKRIANSIKPTQKDVREVYIDKAMVLLEEDCSKLQETAVLDYLLDFRLVAERVYELFDADKEITGPIMSDFIEQADIFIQEKYGIGVFGFDERAVLYSVNEAYDQNGVRITDNFFQSFKSNDFYESNNRRWAQIMRNSLWSKARNTLNIPKENNEQLNLFDDLIG